MKVFAVRLMTVLLSVAAVAVFACPVFAQGNGNGNGNGGGGNPPPPPPPLPNIGVGYRCVWPVLPANLSNPINPVVRDFVAWTDIATGRKHAIAVGFIGMSNNPTIAYVYDHGGLIDPIQVEKIYTIHDLFPTLPAWVPATHTMSYFYGVNKSGRIVGVFRNPDNSTQNIPFYFELNDLVLHQIPRSSLRIRFRNRASPAHQ